MERPLQPPQFSTVEIFVLRRENQPGMSFRLIHPWIAARDGDNPLSEAKRLSAIAADAHYEQDIHHFIDSITCRALGALHHNLGSVRAQSAKNT
tara:strand:- start:1882 stop:2163 length:282 start_codon:yes stop_codon:yes gene_type:complete